MAEAAGGGLWLPPRAPGGAVLRAVEMHAGGEPLRVVPPGGLGELEALLAGLPLLAARRRWLEAPELDGARRRLMHEPRGHRDMYGAVLVPSELAPKEAAFGALFVHQEGASSMCGHAVLCLARFALDYGLCPRRRRSPPRKIKQHHERKQDVPIEVPGYGKVIVDIGYGGAFYAFLNADQLGLDVSSSRIRDLVDAASAVTQAVKAQLCLKMLINLLFFFFKVHHPEIEDVAFIYGTILTDGKDEFNDEPTSNICVFADAQVDRSPTGSGVTARIALQYHKGLIQLNQTRTFRSSSTGSLFTGKAVKETKCGDHKAVIVEVSGESFYTGTSVFTFEEDDPLKCGFFLK
ncbi:hypothetical protein JRQ81_001249 [Phrynocephalus forsythii]|uniref:trans-L-3-hydroxyproline dehydratase n=1 Tax=Phrynocephalus forsythii TaxID=171643 RepID=A0A9Q1B8W2_9SAUR|nr:hypothetical protein JRQ81_001249 [Phrynocephalus forsythii]